MKRSIRAMLAVAAFVMGSGVGVAQSAAEKILGTYRVVSDVSKEVAKVKISKQGTTYQAQIVWLEKPLDNKGQVKRDRLNPDPVLRSVAGDKIVLAWGLKYDNKSNEWSGGNIYDPDSGKTYKALFKFENATTLKVRGYVGVPALGRTLYWTKIE